MSNYILKQIPEDFVVTEVSNLNVLDNGKFAYVLMKKTNRNTLDCVREIAKQLNIREKDVGFAGSKDKNAVTSQLISIKNVSKEKIASINVDNVSLKIVGYNNKPISLGDLSGNKFEIVVRDLDSVKVQETNFVANYFDEQRFSVHNVAIGRNMIKKEFKEAVKLMNDTRADEHLEKHKNDSIGAMKKLPKRLLMMYVHSYQSYLWNETLRIYLEENSKVVNKMKYSLGEFVFVSEKKFLQIPLIGFNDGLVTEEVKEIIDEIMKKEKLKHSDFIIKQIPELSLEGDLRNAFVDVKDLKIGKTEKDELNTGKKKVKVYFSLGKGSYATMVVRKLIN
ncbi:tRNA pseudouridine(13) synthase TruD [Candidatus Woesearchaeota archaeon]|jgi:tRNA pseudouridine13 synthase|nr:tRNA pseudouridine(13) synthase TruD [Candidatus Woesearchaeota archaeon]MBT4110797.1 tRNA pseudouridine(13) synthase TruD [Candidatus Woesearchaeota archaeon]MBT4336691.1 tRNA pseudouridine(13) synthase TruD [Candidatus Woesearchaeota archaeon]MBT4469560.1 tRNA pseudouridine(13) synthase TruD [Candidatus Woesearchaeota archaeon]MBT6743922.1 tRNA pseudouridine(13) synthase TruD [Candidatus Woesearchaeota archaeon]